MASISMSREELMAKLVDARARAEREDAKAAAKHKADEYSALQRFRAALRAALKWNYQTAKKNHMRASIEDIPRCPMREASRMELAIRQLKMDSRKGRFSLNESHDWYRAAMWLPESERLKQSVCE